MKNITLQVVISLLILIGLGALIVGEEYYIGMKAPRMILGTLASLFLPGYWITYCLFPQGKPWRDDAGENEKGIDVLERGALSVALSISVVPLIIFYTNLLSIPLTTWTVYGTILTITLCAILYVVWKNKKNLYDL